MSDDFNPTPSMVKDALAGYREGNRAPWVERWLAADYTRLLSTIEACRAELAAMTDDRDAWTKKESPLIKRLEHRALAAEAALAEARKEWELAMELKHPALDTYYFGLFKEARRERDEAREQVVSFLEQLREARAANAENARLATLNGQEVVRLTGRVKYLSENRVADNERLLTENAALLAKIEKMEGAIVNAAEDLETGGLSGLDSALSRLHDLIAPAPSTPAKPGQEKKS